MNVCLMGASVRALAESVRRSNAVPIAFDLFADRDLKAIAHTTVLPRERYPYGFRDFMPQLREQVWAYTGGLENYPDLLDELASQSTLLGNPGAVVRAVRDPLRMRATIDAWSSRAGAEKAGVKVRVPTTLFEPNSLPSDGSWLMKPQRGSGGRGIVPWRGQPISGNDCFWQKRVDGLPHSAVFIAGPRTTQLVGISRQMIGEAFCRAAPFHYCGNVIVNGNGIVPSTGMIAELGDAIARDHGLRGVFGVDFLLDQNSLWVLEVNPRYPASAELFERRDGASIFAAHRLCFASGSATDGPEWPTKNGAWGKAVLYANADFVLDFDLTESTSSGRGICLADIPARGQRFESGEPIVTVLAKADDSRQVSQLLHMAAAGIYGRITCQEAAGRPGRS